MEFHYYKCGGKLVGERTRRSLKTAYDAGSSREKIERGVKTLDEVASEWGLTLSLPKTKLLVAGTWNDNDLQPITIRGESIEAVPKFWYL